ncbi:DUF2442 domain-containing protein [uncultured Rhodospira sp.]|uniref:DUF2442 domain-containing protein n=1 Tax=uncultured Rhodospira sp. TaxID=1936189 RepID=UPI002638AEB9|nr:DUF2442 domain-containing protein [uncultured Rhodospira sp.]
MPSIYDDAADTMMLGPGPSDPEDWHPTILSVDAGPDYTLTVTLTRGRVLCLDMTGVVFGDPVFEPARDPVVFATAHPGEDGFSIVWGDDDTSLMDIASDTVLEMAEAQRPLSGADLRAWQGRHGLNNRETAAMLDTSPRTIQRYHDADRLPSPIRLALRAMDQRPAVFSALYRPSMSGRPRRPGTSLRPGRPAKG